ncbi:MAG: hypothetical protein KDK65_06445, partial [Chlamydiia bacterium]|nr:hypothetical protein [Chlamydiia bacterium]
MHNFDQTGLLELFNETLFSCARESAGWGAGPAFGTGLFRAFELKLGSSAEGGGSRGTLVSTHVIGAEGMVGSETSAGCCIGLTT